MAEYAVGRPAPGGVNWGGPTRIVYSASEPVTVTKRQLDLLRFIDDTQRRTGRTPSYREMGEAVYGAASTGGVPHQIRQLTAKGLIERQANRVKGITLRVALLRYEQ